MRTAFGASYAAGLVRPRRGWRRAQGFQSAQQVKIARRAVSREGSSAVTSGWRPRTRTAPGASRAANAGTHVSPTTLCRTEAVSRFGAISCPVGYELVLLVRRCSDGFT